MQHPERFRGHAVDTPLGVTLVITDGYWEATVIGSNQADELAVVALYRQSLPLAGVRGVVARLLWNTTTSIHHPPLTSLLRRYQQIQTGPRQVTEKHSHNFPESTLTSVISRETSFTDRSTDKYLNYSIPGQVHRSLQGKILVIFMRLETVEYSCGLCIIAN